MDTNHKGVKIDRSNNGFSNLKSPAVVVIEESGRDDESQALLSFQDVGLSKDSEKRKSVQWLDKNGDKLAEILEFQPSDVSDSDEEESDSCMCRIM
ncbi:uncharacterized protein LOC105158483 [Sesamum indicum]|uniref:Uncharacterized protein LOC105158483 n=1 Tax=Sesamum indicum TaxID=4182 RepID=A0A6I9T0E2_SESIN|nr:uncharacterized protein LOC105158483 [Sesamum indicum]